MCQLYRLFPALEHMPSAVQNDVFVDFYTNISGLCYHRDISLCTISSSFIEVRRHQHVCTLNIQEKSNIMKYIEYDLRLQEN